MSPSTARTLLQRGLRLNGESVSLWREYVRMELAYVERLRRRWDKLGVRAAARLETTDMDVPEDEGEMARQLVLDGEIVREVIGNATKGSR